MCSCGYEKSVHRLRATWVAGLDPTKRAARHTDHWAWALVRDIGRLSLRPVPASWQRLLPNQHQRAAEPGTTCLDSRWWVPERSGSAHTLGGGPSH
jgi:hypothetical protein